MDTNFIFECSTRYLTSERRKRVRYRVQHEKIKFVSSSGHVIYCLLYKQQYQGYFSNFPKISEDFPKISEDFLKLFEQCSKFIRTFPIIFRKFPKISEGCRMLPSNRRRCFNHTEENLGSFDKLGKRDSTYDVIVIFTCEYIKFIFTREDIMFSQ